MRKKSELPVYFLHLLTLNGFAVVQAVLGLLGDNADFFIAHGSQPVDLLVLVAVLVFSLPLVLLVLYRLLAGISLSALKTVHYLVVGVLIAIILLPFMKGSGSGDIAQLWLASLCGLLFAYGYHKFGALRMFVTALSPATLIFAGVFLFGPASQELRATPESSRQNKPLNSASDTPIVMLIFDELALAALMDVNRGIDRSVFPNFARLADRSHWYRNATTVAGSTMLAVPAILTGKYPKKFIPQSFKNYPQTLFTLLADSHHMNVFESTTSLCAPSVCPRGKKNIQSASRRLGILHADVSAVFLHIITPESFRANLPVINMTWDNYWQLDGTSSFQRHNYGGRLSQLAFFIDSITQEENKQEVGTGLHFMHINFPHLPYQYLPSGKRYQGEWEIPSLDFSTNRWSDNQWLITQAYQRYLLQLAAADLVIGQLIDQLESANLFDKSMLLILADHGVSFYPNSGRRDAPPELVLDRDILPVPLFIKYPQQRDGAVSDENVETIDILPTIADVLDIPVFAATDGRSLLGNQPVRAEKLAFRAYRDFIRYSPPVDGEKKYRTLQWKLDVFGQSGGLDSLYNIGQNRHLLGVNTDTLVVRADPELAIQLDMPALYDEVDTRSGFIPAQVSGKLRSETLELKPELVIAVNGVIRATTQAYPVAGGYRFTAMVPEEAFTTGHNRVSVFPVTTDPRHGLVLLAASGQVTNQAVGGEWTLGKDAITGRGVQTSIVEDHFKGVLEYASLDGGTAEFFGWAVDMVEHGLPDRIIIFDKGKSVYSNVTSMPRNEGKLHGAPDAILTGFQFIIPANLLNLDGAADIRLFAVSADGYASELEYFDTYRWTATATEPLR